MICQECGAVVKRHQNGARYALEQERLTKKQEQLLAWWLSNHPFDHITKEQIVTEFKYVDQDGINARISELKALGFVNGLKGEYLIDPQLTSLVLNNHGILKKESRVE